MLVKEAYNKAILLLEQHSIENANLNAEVLIRSIYEWDRNKFIQNFNQVMNQDKYLLLNKMIDRRIKNEPLQYITGVQNFYGRDFNVNSEVLIPRPETELLVEAVINEANNLWGNRPITVVDIGTGSGAIAITLSLEKSTWKIHAIDISDKALQVALDNMKMLEANVTFHQGNLLSPLQDKNILVDVIVSNPPYISINDLSLLSSEVKDYEPTVALYGGIDGLDFYRRILEESHSILKIPGIIAFEIGIGQAREIEELLENSGAKKVNEILDYQSIPRILIAWF